MLISLSCIALFSFTSSLYCVVELANAEAEVIVQIEHGNLTADVQVTVETLNGGSATGMCLLCNKLYMHHHYLQSKYKFYL